MGLFDTSSSLDVQINLMVRQQAQAYDYIVALIKNQAAKVYGQPDKNGVYDPTNAIAMVAAMGTRAVAIFTLSSVFANAVNSTATVVGKAGVGTVLPTGFTFTPNADGSGTLTYTAPAVSSSSSATSSSSTGTSSSSSAA